MYLFTRTARLAPGHIRESLAWAADITDRVNRLGIVEANLWSRVMSPGFGTLGWSAVVPDLATIETVDAKLQADEGYLDAVDAAATLLLPGSVDDAVYLFVHGAPDGTAQTPPEYVAAVEATIQPGAMQDGLALGVEIAERAQALSGHPTAFCMATTGAFGRVAWFTAYGDIESLQAGEQATYADQAFMELLDGQAATAYEDGETSVLRRLI